MTEPVSPGDRTGIVGAPLRLLRWGLGPVVRVLPWKRPDARERLDAAIRREQLRILERAFAEEGGIGVFTGRKDDTGYLYRPGRLLVGDDDLEGVATYFRKNSRRFGGEGRSTGLIGGLHAYELPPKAEVPQVLDELDRAVRVDAARPDHVLYVTIRGTGKLCPADEPRPPCGSDPVPAVSQDPKAGSDVRVSVVDTGWWEPAETTGASPWLHDVDGEPDPVDQADIQSYAGHGTFVSGIVRCLAPAAGILNEAIMVKGGAAFESDIVQQLHDAVLQKFEPHVISISAGTYTRNDRGLLAFEQLWRAEQEREGKGGVLVVAAAGNDHTRRPFWPAAYPWVVGVGALDEDGSVSDFSNTGPWVDVYAHGRDLVNAFPSGRYVCKEPPHAPEERHFEGLAQWSGTSFSTPIVSGAIAAHMSATGLSAREAADELIARGRPLDDGHGNPIVAVGPPFA